MGATHGRRTAGCLRRSRADPRGRGSLRRALVFGKSANARNRHSHGDGRADGKRVEPGGETGNAARHCGSRVGTGGCVCRYARSFQPAIWSQRARSPHLRQRHADFGDGSYFGLLHTGTKGGTRRSVGCAALRVTKH